MMLKLSPIQLTLSFVSTLALAGCGGDGPAPAPGDAGQGEAAATMPATHWSAAPLADAQEVRAVRDSAKDGDRVVLRGTLADFGELATFSLVDDALLDCTETGPDDQCETPWDYCCADPEELSKYTVNVEFLEDDLPGEWSLRGQHGLDHLAEVTVAGTLRVDEAGNLRLEATKMALQ